MGVIEEIRSGNREAIKEVYKENVRDVYNFAKSITGNHDSALEATKKTFVILFNRIQKGENPTNIRLSALKIAYDEACAIAMPSTDVIDSPYDKEDKPDELRFNVSDKKDETAGAQETSADPEPEESAQDESVSELEEPANEAQNEQAKPEEEKLVLNDDEDETDEDPADKPSKKKKKKKDVSYDDYDDEDEDEDEEEKKKHPVVSTILLIINIILVIILVWFILGLLQNLEIIPENINMGHEWFNNNIYPLF